MTVLKKTMVNITVFKDVLACLVYSDNISKDCCLYRQGAKDQLSVEKMVL
jgi:hypothetical protein